MSAKIQEMHRNKPAYIYLRQSTMGQVRHNRESTERQYDLKNRALENGWPQSKIKILDRDLGQSGTEHVRGAVAIVFQLFRETGSAYGVVRQFAEQGIKFPKRAYGGAWNGRLIWGRLGHGRVLTILRNPSYAGAYAYGRYQHVKELSPDGNISTKTIKVPMADWRVMIRDHHEAYIGWDEFCDNQTMLEKNQTNKEAMLLSGPAREGLALLHGLRQMRSADFGAVQGQRRYLSHL
jgi:hypothetical protein